MWPLLPQQHIDRASSTIGPRGIGVSEHGPMLPEALTHPRLQDRDLPFGVCAPAMDDTDAAMADSVDQAFHVRDSFRSGHAMQIEPAAGSMFPARQPSELTPVHTWGEEAGLGVVWRVWPGRRRRGRSCRASRADVWSSGNPSAGIWNQPNDVRHRAREVLGVGVRGALAGAPVRAVIWLSPPRHTPILSSRAH
jgi:hypothetical protein